MWLPPSPCHDLLILLVDDFLLVNDLILLIDSLMVISLSSHWRPPHRLIKDLLLIVLLLVVILVDLIGIVDLLNLFSIVNLINIVAIINIIATVNNVKAGWLFLPFLGCCSGCYVLFTIVCHHMPPPLLLFATAETSSFHCALHEHCLRALLCAMQLSMLFVIDCFNHVYHHPLLSLHLYPCLR